MTISGAALLETLRDNRLLDEDTLDKLDAEYRTPPADGGKLADELRQRGHVTAFQLGYLLQGKPSDLTLGQYVLLDRLGEGGMGQVFKAYHRVLKSLRAVKVIRPDCITSKATVRRFYREIELVAKLKHPNIIHAYDADQAGDRHYFVMEYAPGQDLAHVIKQGGPLSVGHACDYIRQAAMGLQHAHEHGLVHRDIKPSNLLLSSEDGCVKVLDLGLAKLREATPELDDAARPMTPAGMMMGTPDFMAPEQAENAAMADIRADIYSLGCTLYQMLAGRVPFPCNSLVEKLTKHYAEKAEPLTHLRADIPAGVQAVVERMMEKEPSQRYQTPAEVVEALAPYCGASGGPAHVAPVEPGATIAPGTRMGQSIIPPGGSSGTALGSSAGDPSYIPQTMQLESDSVGAARPSPKRGKDSRTVAMTEAPYSLTAPPETAVGQATPAPGLWKQPAAPPKRKPLLIAAGVGTVLAAVAVFGFASGWFGQGGSPSGDTGNRVVNRDDVRPSDDSRVVKDNDDVKKTEKDVGNRVNPVPVTRAPLGIAKGIGGGSPGQVAQAKAGKGDGAASVRGLERSRDDWQKPEVITPLMPQVVQVAFSANGKRAAVRTKAALYVYDTGSKASPETISLLQLLGNRVGSNPTVGEALLSPDGLRIVFATISTTDKEVRGQKKLNAEYDTLAAWDYSRLLLFYDAIVLPRDGMITPNTRCLAISPDGTSSLVGADRQVNRWVLASAAVHSDEPAARYEAGAAVECVASSPDGKYVVAGLDTGGLRLFQIDKKDDAGIEYQEQKKSYVRAVCFLSGNRLLSGHSTGQVCLWPDATGKGKGEAVGPKDVLDAWHARAVTCIAAPTQGDVFATGSLEGELALGEAGAAKPLWKGMLDKSPVKALVFAADGSSLLYATEKVLGRLPLLPPSPAVAKPAKLEPVGVGKKDIVQS